MVPEQSSNQHLSTDVQKTWGVKVADWVMNTIGHEKSGTIDTGLWFLTKVAEVIARYDISRQIPDEVKEQIKRNSNYSPLTDQVQEAMALYEKHSGGKLSWEGVFKNRTSLQELLNRPLTYEEILSHSHLARTAEQHASNSEGNRVVAEKLKTVTTIKDLILLAVNPVPRGFDFIYFGSVQSIISNILNDKKGEIHLAQDMRVYDFGGSEFFIQAKTFVEQKVKEVNRPLTFSELLLWSLTWTKGDVGVAADNLAQFLKTISRSHVHQPDLYSIDSKENQSLSADWIQHHVADTFNPLFSYQSIPHFDDEHATPDPPVQKISPRPVEYQPRRKRFLFEKIFSTLTGNRAGDFDTRFHRVNLIGQPYRAAELFRLYLKFGPDLVSFFVAGEYFNSGADQGPVKLFADMLQLQDLRKLDKHFNKLK